MSPGSVLTHLHHFLALQVHHGQWPMSLGSDALASLVGDADNALQLPKPVWLKHRFVLGQGFGLGAAWLTNQTLKQDFLVCVYL